jgi:hypothetical protein
VFKYILHEKIMKLKIIKPSLVLKIHRKLILAQKNMKLILDFLKRCSILCCLSFNYLNLDKLNIWCLFSSIISRIYYS